MKLRIVSDLHFEFHADAGATLAEELAQGDFEALVVAGDLSNHDGLATALATLCGAIAPRRLIYVLGNHEGYGGRWQSARSRAERLQRQLRNLAFLEQSIVTLDGHRFIGCTLWYRHSEQPEPLDRHMADFSEIRDIREFLPKTATASVAYLRATVRPGDIVITHHLPHPRSIGQKFAESPINGYFLHDVSDLVEFGGAALWVHGHTHVSCDYEVGATRVLCNPFGYAGRVPGEPNPDFRADCDVKL